KLLEMLGEGGCGMVYLAEQTEPVRRRVALKVIKLGMDTKQVVARFEAERQALAMMDHPNIAKALDAGTTDAGRPYFVMELVRGIGITEYCDQANLSTRERLERSAPLACAVVGRNRGGGSQSEKGGTIAMSPTHEVALFGWALEMPLGMQTGSDCVQVALNALLERCHHICDVNHPITHSVPLDLEPVAVMDDVTKPSKRTNPGSQFVVEQHRQRRVARKAKTFVEIEVPVISGRQHHTMKPAQAFENI